MSITTIIGKNKNELSAVLDSLSKLAELENRISSLEKDNTHDYLLSKEASSGTRAQGPSGLEFKRKRVNVNSIGPGGKGPLGVKYSVGVKQKQSSWQQQQQQSQQRSGVVGGVSRGSGVMAARVGRYNNTAPVQRPVAGTGPARSGYQNGRLNNNQKALTSKMNAGGGGGVFLTGIYRYIDIYIHVYIYIYFVYIYMYIYMYIYICICIYTSYIYVYLYI
jgi:hypothetical protein